MQSTIEVTIGPDRYELQMLNARKGQRLLTDLLRVAGPALGSLADVGALPGESEKAMGAFIEKLAVGLDANTFERMTDMFGKHSSLIHDDQKRPLLEGVVFEQHFAGRYGALILWLIQCIKYNYSDFLDVVTSGALPGVVGASSRSTSPKT